MKNLIFLFILIFTILFCYCTSTEEYNKEIYVPPELTSTPSVEYMIEKYKPIVKDYVPYLKVKILVKGEPGYIKISLSAPDGSTLDDRYLSKTDLVDGTETIVLQMAEYGETPVAGIYVLRIFDYWGNLLHTKNLEFSGAQLRIRNIDVDYECHGILMKTCDIYEIRINVENKGDLPVIIDDIKIYIDNQEVYMLPSFVKYVILPNDYKEIKIATEGSLPSDIYTFTIYLYSNQKIVAKYSTKIKLK
jgi:hypothetical protein